MKKIITDRLVLRPWSLNDKYDLYNYAKNPNIGLMCGWRPHTDLNNSEEILKMVLMNDKTFAITLNDISIGSIGYMTKGESNINLDDNEVEIGYWLAEEYWNNGYMTEALNALINYLQQELHYNNLYCAYFEENNRSKRVLEKCNFRFTYIINSYHIPLLDRDTNLYVTKYGKK